ncbi:EF-hand calcium-binding domain-containing protein 11-like [Antedon mediterranea]|uniref:EF-hand calcium-binding domain-containing protein 11-like n=1 Tax=Antedon mediterranea TaxID=105859 RepID=UPI003AF66BDE
MSNPNINGISPTRVNQEQLHLLKQVFFESDDSQKGFLDRQDVKVAVLSLLGYKPSKFEVDEILGCNKGITLQGFIEIMLPKLQDRDNDDEIRQIFMTFDMQCKGFINAVDLQRVFSEVAPHIPTHRIHSVFSEIDRDGDGRVSYKDFEFMMQFHVGD